MESQRIGHYALLGKLATGGMAELYLARQSGPQGFSKTVVVKRILQPFGRDDRFVQMFLNEARLAALLNHPNIVSIYELLEDRALADYSIVMEFIDGRNLKAVVHAAIAANGTFPVHLACRIIADAASALQHAHELSGEDGRPLGLIHRDVSPENILVSYSGQVKLADFGIAKAMSSEGLTVTGQVKGKFSYMSPEQIAGVGVDRRTDVWALAVTLYWMLAGVKPFRGDNQLELIQKITSSEPAPLQSLRPDVPPAIRSALTRCLQKDPEKRTPTAAALQEELETWLAASGTVATSLTLSSLQNKLFPPETDAERQFTRRLLAGDFQQMAPTDLPLLPGKRSTDVSQLSLRASGNGIWKAAIAGAGLALVAATIVYVVARPQPQQTTDRELPEAARPVDPAIPPLEPLPPSAPLATDSAPSPPPSPAGAPTPAPLPVTPPKADAVRRPPAHRAEPVGKGPPGTLTFRVLPWADVFVDGTHVGTTPFEPLQLPSGKHEIRLVNDRLEAEKHLSVTVKPGESTVVNARLP